MRYVDGNKEDPRTFSSKGLTRTATATLEVSVMPPKVYYHLVKGSNV